MEFKTKPYAHQQDAYAKWNGAPFFALFMEQGTGKTKVLLDIASTLYDEKKINAVMVIAPKGVYEQWAFEQIPMHASVPCEVYVHRASASAVKKASAFIATSVDRLKVYCINVEAFSSDSYIDLFKRFVSRHNTLICVDEGTRIKNPTAKRTLNIIHGLSNLEKYGKRITKVLPLSKYRILLTGTMVTNNPYDIWTMFEFLQPNFFGINYFCFKARYGIEKRVTIPGRVSYTVKVDARDLGFIRAAIKNGFGRDSVAQRYGITAADVEYIIANPDLRVPYKNLSELKHRIDPSSYIVKKRDCLDLPPKVYEKVYIEMSAAQKKVYNELKDDLFSEYKGVELTVTQMLTLTMRLAQVAGGFFPTGPGEPPMLIDKRSAKAVAICESIEEISSFPILIFARFVCEVEEMARVAKETFPDLTVDFIHGGVKDRESKIDAFKRGEISIFVATQGVLGIGQNLQNSHVMLFYSNSFSLEEREQTEARIDRIGQTESAFYCDYIVKNTIDAHTHKALTTKKALLDYMRKPTIEEFLIATEE